MGKGDSKHIRLELSTTDNFFGLKVGKGADFDLLLDDFTIE